jgi:hypothetical protein
MVEVVIGERGMDDRILVEQPMARRYHDALLFEFILVLSALVIGGRAPRVGIGESSALVGWASAMWLSVSSPRGRTGAWPQWQVAESWRDTTRHRLPQEEG